MNLPNLPGMTAPTTTAVPAPTAAAGVPLPNMAPPSQAAPAANYAAPPAPAAPAAAFADPFAGIGMSQPMDRTPSAPSDMDALVEVLRCEALQAPNMGTGYLVHYKVIECARNPELVGQEYAWKNWAKNPQPFKTACAGFVKAVYGLGNSVQDTQILQTSGDQAIRDSFGEKQTFAGQRLRLITVGTKTRNGHDFVRHDWSHVQRAA